ncbi:MAG: DEAD/DEAH box helicase [Treponema sp.]|jgi:superfamily II DNA/RNA helicase|nr:DEAD/DEAH box helicase [Treponema sp.]
MTNDFEQLGAASCFIGRLEERSITKVTDIQRKIIPPLAEGESIFFSSATGTGKTFAYLLPLLSRLLIEKTERSLPRLLIIAPTLELCSQISAELDFLLKETDLHSSLLIGSVNIERQIENLKKTKPDIIVGNPNRLVVLAKKRIIKFNNLQSLVLDEADRLVSDEMISDTSELCKIILQETKKADIKLIITACSATMNKKYREKLFSICGRTIPFVESEDNEILREKIEHWAIFSEKRKKDQALRSLLAAIKTNKKGKAGKKKIKALVFTSRGDEASLILSRLQYHHVPSAGLFGKAGKKTLSSAERKAALETFRQGSVDALISTDLAARGLDIPGITHVIALDVPSDSEVYIHRCGRTGRAGKRGIMVTIGDETQMRLLAVMEKKLKIRVQPKEMYYGKVCDPIIDEE